MNLQSLPCYCATLRQAARAVTALHEEVLADSGIHATQFTALQVLKIVPNLTTTELADAIGIDQTTATRTLALVRKSGLVIDTPGSDRRERAETQAYMSFSSHCRSFFAITCIYMQIHFSFELTTGDSP